MRNDNLLRLQHILEAIEKIKDFTKGIDREQFLRDEKTAAAVLLELQIIGEALNHMDDDFRGAHLDVPTEDIIALRNRIVHEYFGISRSTIWNAIQKGIPKLQEQVQAAIATLEKQTKEKSSL